MKIDFVKSAMSFRGGNSGFNSPRMETYLNHFLAKLKDGNISFNVEKDVKSFKDLGIGIKPLQVLNIENLHFVSETAKNMPAQIVPFVDNLHKALTPAEMHEALIGGIELGLICFTEKQVTQNNKPPILNMLINPNTHQVLNIQLGDFVSKQDIMAIVTFIPKEGENHFAVKATPIPWVSPSVIAGLNELFGCNWHVKHGDLISPAMIYNWGQYGGANDDVEDKLFEFNVSQLFGTKIPAQLNPYLAEYLDNPIGFLDDQEMKIWECIRNPQLRELNSQFYWDLALIRGQMIKIRLEKKIL